MKKSFPDLSPSYRRNIGTALSILDKVLCEIEELAKGREVHSLLYWENNRLLTAQRKALLSEIAEIRSVLAELKEELGLEAKVQSAAGFVWSQCSGLWVSLSEIDSRRLKGYGTAPDGFSQYWDSRLSELKEHLNRILEVIKSA